MRCALILELLGTVMLFLAFQATSSNVKIITTLDQKTSICINDFALFNSEGAPPGGGVIGGACPQWPGARSVAVVNFEKPYLVTIGFCVLTLGFLIQFLAIPSPKTISQIRKELKEAQLREKAKRSVK
jgi:hypothetical protein